MVWKDYGPDGNPTRVGRPPAVEGPEQQNERVAYELAIRLEPFAMAVCTAGTSMDGLTSTSTMTWSGSNSSTLTATSASQP